MIFDKFCGIAERHWPGMVETLKEAKLFAFDKPAHTLPKQHPPERVEWLQENFFLPFPTVAVEDPGSCILFTDTQPNARGLLALRGFAECFLIDADPTAFKDGSVELIEYMKRDFPPGTVMIASGLIRMRTEGGHSYEIQGDVTHLIAATKHELLISMKPTIKERNLFQGALRNAAVGIEELMMLNTPDRFVLEITPAKPRKNSGKKIPRSDERPRYTILYPHEIRKVMGISEPSGERGSPRPHERRAHTRTFRSDRYKEAKGKTIIVPATWVGPSESVREGKRYRVMLDL